mmetsp:Transcript_25014/g.47520  ORF Transcript_25014/g.47520 Transcript_25014/m.47520 type:complete len:113 (+) Transcript_25014:10-348(+)
MIGAAGAAATSSLHRVRHTPRPCRPTRMPHPNNTMLKAGSEAATPCSLEEPAHGEEVAPHRRALSIPRRFHAARRLPGSLKLARSRSAEEACPSRKAEAAYASRRRFTRTHM